MKTALSVLVSLFIYSSAMSQNFFPVEEGDTLHYREIYYEYDFGVEFINYSYQKNVVTSAVFNDQTFYKVLDHYYRYNPQGQKLYTIFNNHEIISVDFNTPNGGTFYGSIGGGDTVLWNSSGVTNGKFAAWRKSVITPDEVWYNYYFDFTDNKGFTTYSSDYWNFPSRHEIKVVYYLIEAKGKKYSFTFPKPTLTISTLPLIKDINAFPFNVSFAKDHLYPELIDTLCAFIKVYRNGNLIISKTSTPTAENPNSFPINLTPGELQQGDTVKLSFLMTDSALTKNRIMLPEDGSYYNIVVIRNSSNKWFLQNPYPTSSTIFALDYKSSKILYAAGEGGSVLRTTDAGNTWDDLSSFEDFDFRSVSFPDPSNGYAIGGLALVFKTSDGGITWSKKEIHNYIGAKKTCFANASSGVVVMDQSFVIYITGDGGLNWSSVRIDDFGTQDFAYKNSLEGILVGYDNIWTKRGFIYKTSDSGSHWEKKYSSVFGLNSCSFVNDSLAFAAGDYLVRSVDGGNTWTKLGWYHPTTKISFSDIKNGFSLNKGKLEKTTDGGLLWSNVNTGNDTSFTEVQMLDSSNVLLFAQSGLILKSTDGGLNWFSISKGFRNTLYGSFLIDENTGFAVGTDGKILRTINGGGNWTEVQSPTNVTLKSIFFSDGETGTAVGDNGVILRTTNGGTLWSNESCGTTGNLNCVSFLNNDYGFAAGAGVILKTTNGGITWNSKSLSKNFNGISFSDMNTGTVVGDNGVIFRSTDGGENWVEQQSGTTNNLYSVDFKDSENGVAVGSSGCILKTSNGGVSWSASQYVQSTLRRVKFIDSNNLAAVGEAGTLLKSADAGSLWSIERINTKKYLYDISVKDSLNTIIVGQGGTIMSSNKAHVTLVNNDTKVIETFRMEQNYPNPFNPSTTIKYSLASFGKVKITVFDILGREVKVLVDEEKSPGTYTIRFSGFNLSSGVYFYQIKAGNFVQTKKMLLLK